MGVGRMRHIGVSHLYIQELVKTKQVITGKVDGKENTLDILTKHSHSGTAENRMPQVRIGRS